MKYLVIFAFIAILSNATTDSASNGTKKPIYNILALDGGGIRGIIAAVIIDYMEREAYTYAVTKGYIEKQDTEKLSMGNLFDLVAGTSTGSILAAGLVYPKEQGSNQPRYYAENMIDLYENDGPVVFQATVINYTWCSWFAVVFFIIGGILGLKIGGSVYSNPAIEKTHRVLKQYIHELKKESSY